MAMDDKPLNFQVCKIMYMSSELLLAAITLIRDNANHVIYIPASENEHCNWSFISTAATLYSNSE